ncbi:LysR family transcriptional regulator [Burkholderia sp. Leaf177]|uniref:LysR substrate-binding domain-containing protein n=1 Tax=Burkholderia sp. Leaf177 TaxID=1736287 RepID=UPI0006F3B6BD|nr:LysR substrate-binding domain-containing protein [Burkholderia sp. Leaf177]KQR81656.1 LysR family transcriptional regulator [Burkholderia sp. Leaf177]
MPTPLVRLASLDLIRGFVAVGRRMSITLAAEDLCLTQSALSRQVHALEDLLGIALFKRGYRSISFTPEGERLFRIADTAVQQLQDVFETLNQPQGRLPVTITASIGVTGLWLLPRLNRFQQRHPELDLRVAAIDKNLDLRAEGIDLGIRYCTAATAPPGAVRLFEEAVVPVAHPSLGLTRLDDNALLRQKVLLEFEGPRRPLLRWADQLAAMGLDDAHPSGMLRFNQYDQVIQAALAGQGIALGRIALIEPLLADGRLIALADGTAGRTTAYGYWLYQADEKPRQDVLDVVEWIRSEAREVEAVVERMLSAQAAR